MAVPVSDLSQTQPTAECDGSLGCTAATHLHGCFADRGDCDHPSEHGARVFGGPVSVDVQAAPQKRWVVGLIIEAATEAEARTEALQCLAESLDLFVVQEIAPETEEPS